MDWKESTDEGEGGEYKMPKYYFLNMYEKQNRVKAGEYRKCPACSRGD